MKRYTLDETRGDIAYEVDGDKLILRVSPHFMGSLPTDNYYLITTGDDTVPSDYNVFSAKRVMEEVGKSKSYWELTEAGILTPVGDYPVVSKSDVVAYAKASPVATAPVASTSTFGLVKVAVDDALVVKGGVISINKKALNGFDVNQLEEYLNNHGYVSSMTTLKGYEIAKEYQPIAESDTIVSALGKLERGVRNIQDDYVTIGTDQTIIGQKTFEKTIVGNSDVVAYATGSPIATTPVASTSTFGLVKVANDGVLVIKDGILSVNSSSVGLNEAHLKAYLTANEYATQTWVTNRGYLTSSSLNGYATTSYVDGELSKYVTTETFTSTLSGYVTTGTLESALGNYVTMWSDQTITGQKTFTKTIIGNADVVAYAKASPVATAPVASTSTFGLVKVGSGVSVSGGVISVSGTGGGGTTVSWGSGDSNYCGLSVAGTSKNVSLNGHTHSLSRTTSGSGNAVTNVTLSGMTVTVTYGNVYSKASELTAKVTLDGETYFFARKDPTLGIGFSGGNTVFGYSTGAANRRGNLYLNTDIGPDYHTYIYNMSERTTSDMRLKTKTRNLTNILDSLSALDVFEFYYNSSKKKNIEIGVSAQAVQAHYPLLVSSNSDGYLSLNYNRLNTVFAIGGLKELYTLHLRLANEVRSGAHWRLTKDEQIRHLQRECAELRVRINELEKGGGA